jgi:hypothetical protein
LLSKSLRDEQRDSERVAETPTISPRLLDREQAARYLGASVDAHHDGN